MIAKRIKLSLFYDEEGNSRYNMYITGQGYKIFADTPVTRPSTDQS